MLRRQFLSAVSMTAAWVGGTRAFAAPSRPLRILMLGGTRFIGVHITELALKRGHAVTLFNRGQTNPQLFPKLENSKVIAMERLTLKAGIDAAREHEVLVAWHAAA